MTNSNSENLLGILYQNALKKGYRYLGAIARLRALWLGIFLKSMGRDVAIEKHCTFAHPRSIEIGHHVYINFGNKFLNSNRAGIKLGNYVIIGPNSLFITNNIDYSDWRKPMGDNPAYIHKPIIIKDDVWIGANSTILAGVTIGRGAIVAAGSVVTKDIAPYSIVGGVPAKTIKYRFNQATIKKASRIDWSKYLSAKND